MNALFNFLATRASLLTAIVYPDFSGKVAPNAGGKPFSGDGVNFAQAYNDGVPVDRQAIDFYTAFRNYLRISRPIFDFIRIPASEFAKFLYFLATALIRFFVYMFQIFDVAGDPLGQNYSEIHEVFHYGFIFGMSICVLMMAVYAIGEFFDGASFSRNKNLIRNICLYLFVITGLPTLVGTCTRGATDVADEAFGVNVSNNSQGMKSEAQQLFQNNVYSIPRRVMEMRPGQQFDVGNNLGLKPEQTHGYYDVPTKPLIIRLGKMSQSTRNEYNGLGTDNDPHSISSFLDDYGSNEMLNKDKLNQITTSARDTASKEKSPAGKAKNALTDAMNNLPLVGSYLNSHDQGHTADDFTDLFSYYINDAGPSTSGGMSDEEHNLTKFASFGSSMIKGPKMLYQSYTMYYVNWFAIYSGLIMLILVTATYLYKLFKLFYKLVVMYVSSGFLVARNIDNWGRVKSWFRDFFSIYEMLIMMVVMFKMFFVVYNIINQVIMAKVMDASSGFIANPWVGASLELIADISLFKISMIGIKSVDTMIGSEGGGADTGGMSGFVGNMLAIRGASAVGHDIGGWANNTPAGSAVHGLAHPFKAVSAFRNGKKDHLKKHNQGQAKKNKLSDSGKRKPNKNGGLNNNQKKDQDKKDNPKNPNGGINTSGRNPDGSPENGDAQQSQEDSDDHSGNDSDSDVDDANSSESESDSTPEPNDAQRTQEDSEDHSNDDSDSNTNGADGPESESDGNPESSDVQQAQEDSSEHATDDSDISDDTSEDAPENQPVSNNSDDNLVNNQNTTNEGDTQNGGNSTNAKENQNELNHQTHNANQGNTDNDSYSQNNGDYHAEQNNGGANTNVDNTGSGQHDDRPFMMNGDPGPDTSQQNGGEPDDGQEELNQLAHQDQGQGSNTTNNVVNNNNQYGHNTNNHGPISFKNGGSHNSSFTTNSSNTTNTTNNSTSNTRNTTRTGGTNIHNGSYKK